MFETLHGTFYCSAAGSHLVDSREQLTRNTDRIRTVQVCVTAIVPNAKTPSSVIPEGRQKPGGRQVLFTNSDLPTRVELGSRNNAPPCAIDLDRARYLQQERACRNGGGERGISASGEQRHRYGQTGSELQKITPVASAELVSVAPCRKFRTLWAADAYQLGAFGGAR
jgi:hypothetical protein